MADNVQLNSGSGGESLATDDVGGVQYQRVKLTWGVDGVATDASASNPLPVVQTGAPTLATGAATSANQTTEITALSAIQTAVEIIDNAISGSEMQVDIVSSALPTGAATAAKQPALGTAGTPSADVITVQGNASGTALPVSASSLPLPSGASTESTLSAASAKLPATLGQKAMTASMAVVLASDQSTVPVSLASVPSHAVTNAGTFATQESGAALTALQLIDNLVLAEDAVHGSGDPGVQALAVRQDANAAFAADGDYTPLQTDSNGSLKVAIISGAGSGGTASTDDAAFTAASGSGTPMMGFVTSDSVDSGDVGVIGMLANRQVKVTLFDSGGTELSVGGGTQYTEDAAAAANPIGNVPMLVRDDSLSGALTSANGDNVAQRGNNKGEAYVKATDSDALLTTIDADTGAIATSVASVDGKITACNTGAVIVSSSALPSGASTAANQSTANASLATIAGAVSGTEVQADILTVPSDPFGVNADAASATGSISAKLRFIASTGIPVTGTVTVGSHAVTNAGTFATQESGAALTALQLIDDLVLSEDAASASGDPGVQLLAVRADTPANKSSADSDYEPLQVSSGRLWTSTTVTSLPASTNTLEVVGDVAHDAAVGGNPVLVGARANANEPTAVSADGDAVHLWADLLGRLVVLPGHPNPEAPVTVNATASGNTTVIAAPGASLSLYICKGSIVVGGTENVTVKLQDGASGTDRWAAELASEGGGAMFDFGPRGWKLTANTLLNVNLGAASDVRVNVTEYYIAA